MLRLHSYLLLIMLFLTACTSRNSNIGADGFPIHTQEDIQAIIENMPESQIQNSKKNSTLEFIKNLENSLEEAPDDLNNNYLLAKLHYQKFSKDSLTDDCKKAIPYFSKVIELDPQYKKGHAHYNRMLCYLYSHQLEEALIDINNFVEINKGRTPVNYLAMRAEIFFQKGDKKQACSDYKAALTVAEKDSLPVGNVQVWENRCSNRN